MNGGVCPICGERFDGGTAVRDHAWDAHGACHHCGDGFDEREALYTHWLDAHEGELSRETRKRAETKVGDRTVCPVCTERFASDAAVADHAWEAHGACHYCGDGFDEREALYTHWLAAHGGELTRPDRDRAREAVGTPGFRDRLAHGGPVGAVRGASVSRRGLLAGGAVGAVALAGGAVAVGGLGGNGGGSDGDTSLEGHPAVAALGSQPALGPPPAEADATIVAFEDPSCPSCARFELGTFPRLKSELIEPGTLSFVFRGIPVVYQWGRPAVSALEATYARDEGAFWALKDFYYRSQDSLGEGNVMAETRRFLAGETDVDAAGVREDVESGAYRDAVEADLGASRDAGVRGTPTFFLFRDGSYVTEVVGPQPYQVFANALGV